MLREQPAKVATPLTLVTVVFVHESVPGPDTFESVTDVPGWLVTVLPLASWMATTGCGENEAPGVPAVAMLVKPSFVAEPPPPPPPAGAVPVMLYCPMLA